MDFEFLFIGLATISAFTTLTTEAVKKILDDAKISYSANLLAVLISVLLTIFASIGYIIFNKISITPAVIFEILALMFLSFLCATLGFDKIKQTLIQISNH